MHEWYKPDGDVFLRHRNPDTTADLIIPVELVCNTPDDVLLANIRKNSRRPGSWVKLADAHSGVAVICGSGPSLAETIGDIKTMIDGGAKVFALNNAANWLFEHGIMPDYQVIVDAKPNTKSVIGPAREHLFASQVDPSLFDEVPRAQVWHLNIGGDWEKELPPYDEDYAIIGGTASSGNVATCLAYTLGYRDIHCFGYDSSHRGTQSHVAEQPINAGEPLTYFNWQGKDYLTSFTMKSQADTFLRYEIALREAGASLTVHGYGLLPDMWRYYQTTPLVERERNKYKRMWSKAEYRQWSPGVDQVEAFAKAFPGTYSVIDFGCGTGRAAKELQRRKYHVIGVDIATNALETDITMIEACLWDLPPGLSADVAFCTDVMEHIPREKVDAVLAGISKACPYAYFRIDSAEDCMGRLIGEPLHLTVEPPEWWIAKLGQFWETVTYQGEGVFICIDKDETHHG